MNVLVLGGHGFIGSHVVESLIQNGHNVRVFARNTPSFLYSGEWFAGDFLDKCKLSEALIGMDAVVHSISTTVPATSATDPIYDIQSNLIGTVELLRLMQIRSVHRIVYLSSGGTVYGNPDANPVSENAPTNPISSYGAVKVAIEKFIQISRDMWGIEPVILRPSNPYGERQGHRGVQGFISTVLNNLIKSQSTVIYGDGTAIRDFIYVTDVADLVCKALDSEYTGVYNAGSGDGYSLAHIINTIETVTGMPVLKKHKEARGFDVKKIVLDSSLAEETFNWKSLVPLEAGIKKHFDWLIAHHARTN